VRTTSLRVGAFCAGVLATLSVASAQAIPFTPLNIDRAAANAAFPLQNPFGPSGANYQVNYPYPGQCLASNLNANLFPTLPLCDGVPGKPPSSFACAAPGISNQSAGPWAACGAPFAFKVLSPLVPTAATPKFAWEVLNPPDYAPDKATFPGADYYEIGLHEAWGFQAIATAGLFPNPPATSPRVPNGMQWTGLTCNIVGGCTCPAGLTLAFAAQYCPGGVIPVGAPLFTPIWGVGQINMTGGPVTTLLGGGGTCSSTGAACNPTVVPTTCPAIPTGTCSVDLTACNPTTVPTTCAALPPATPGFCAITIAQVCDPAAPVCPVDPATLLPEACVANPPVAQLCNAGAPIVQTCNAAATNPFVAGPAAPWSPNNYIATWPSISIRANKGTPVVVKWVNEFPNNHVLCTHPDAADWPCSIDRTFMGVKASIDPAIAESQLTGVHFDGVNAFGSPMQPDNSWVTHLHGGEIPPSTDGFAEKWFGNKLTSAMYNDPLKPRYVLPAFENPSGIALKRPAGNSDIYTYPMVQEEATIWFHDHTLGKTHHNVIAGPAGFFPVKEPLKHGPLANWIPPAARPAGSEYTWLDPVTEPRDALGIPLYDLFLAVQDRAFNDDGSINFSNGMGQTIPPPPAGVLPILGQTPVTPGVNPLVHPTWVPEYFGDHSLVNGVLWPRKTVQPGWYRLRIVDGSDSRCYTFGFRRAANTPAPGTLPAPNVPFFVIANDQGYLAAPVRTLQMTMCPGERYELLIDFSNLPGVLPLGQANVYMVNSAPAPFPAGISPLGAASPYAHMNVLMRFDVRGTIPGVQFCGETLLGTRIAPAGLTWNPANTAANLTRGINFLGRSFYSSICMPRDPRLIADPSFVNIRPAMPPPAGTIVRQVYLNEKVDGVTLFPLGMQLNGVPFEYKVTETPKNGTTEVWQFVNLTVDAHPMHPHLVKHQIVQRQAFNVAGYLAALCNQGGAPPLVPGCSPGPAPGGEMQVVPDVTPFLTPATVVPVTNASVEGGWKDASQAAPGMVTTIVAKWEARWAGSGSPGAPPAPAAPAPGTAGCPTGFSLTGVPCAGPPWGYESVASGPYVWHCHINSHEDSEMMRTSLVVQ